MTHLFETNAWLRSVGRIGELNAVSRALLLDPTKAPFGISAISVWEVGNKQRKRPAALDLGLPFADWLAIATKPSLIRVFPVDAEIARLASALPGSLHDDPADRLIVATAIVHQLTILTSDEKILAYAHVQSLDTR